MKHLHRGKKTLKTYIQKPYRPSSQSYCAVWKLSFYFLLHYITSSYLWLWRITPEYSPEPRKKSYTSELVMKLERFEVEALAFRIVSQRGSRVFLATYNGKWIILAAAYVARRARTSTIHQSNQRVYLGTGCTKFSSKFSTSSTKFSTTT